MTSTRNSFVTPHESYEHVMIPDKFLIVCLDFFYFCRVFVQEWLSEYLEAKGMGFFAYLEEMGQSGTKPDSAMLLLLADFLRRKITVVSTFGIWESDSNIYHDLVYCMRKDGHFTRSKVGTYRCI